MEPLHCSGVTIEFRALAPRLRVFTHRINTGLLGTAGFIPARSRAPQVRFPLRHDLLRWRFARATAAIPEEPASAHRELKQMIRVGAEIETSNHGRTIQGHYGRAADPSSALQRSR
jgi:hypothetical protein